MLIDREQGGKENLRNDGIETHSVFTITEMIDALANQQAISAEQAEVVRQFISESRK